MPEEALGPEGTGLLANPHAKAVEFKQATLILASADHTRSTVAWIVQWAIRSKCVEGMAKAS